MGFGRSISTLVLLTACGSDGAEDTANPGFRVASASPSQGDMDVTTAHSPEFRLSARADSTNCAAENFLLIAIDENGEVAFEMDYSVFLQDGGNKLILTHSEPFLKGYWYAAMALHTDSPCLSEGGLTLEPFGVEFFVP
jgi:hypothetical protein